MSGAFEEQFATAETASPLHNVEAEIGFLGDLLANNRLIDEVADRCRPADFSVPLYGRIYGKMIEQSASGAVDVVTLAPHFAEDDGASAYQIARAAGYGGTQTQWLASLRVTDGKNGADGKSAAALLGTVTITQTATVALTAGIRRVVITVPASLGLAPGDPIVLAPTKSIDGYAIHDAIAVSATSINVGISAPLLAVGGTFSITAKLFRLNT